MGREFKKQDGFCDYADLHSVELVGQECWKPDTHGFSRSMSNDLCHFMFYTHQIHDADQKIEIQRHWETFEHHRANQWERHYQSITWLLPPKMVHCDALFQDKPPGEKTNKCDSIYIHLLPSSLPNNFSHKTHTFFNKSMLLFIYFYFLPLQEFHCQCIYTSCAINKKDHFCEPWAFEKKNCSGSVFSKMILWGFPRSLPFLNHFVSWSYGLPKCFYWKFRTRIHSISLMEISHSGNHW